MTDNELIDQFMEPLCIENMPYDKDWNLLMPVVEKIHSLDFPNVGIQIERFRTTLTSQGCWLQYFYNKQCGGKIGATHMAVLEFVKWYNELLKIKEPTKM